METKNKEKKCKLWLCINVELNYLRIGITNKTRNTSLARRQKEANRGKQRHAISCVAVWPSPMFTSHSLVDRSNNVSAPESIIICRTQSNNMESVHGNARFSNYAERLAWLSVLTHNTFALCVGNDLVHTSALSVSRRCPIPDNISHIDNCALH